jgi:hypothetical protein
MIGQPGIICCPKLDNLGKKGGGVVLEHSRKYPGPLRHEIRKILFLEIYGCVLLSLQLRPREQA